MLSLPVLEDVISQYYPFIPQDAGDGTQLLMCEQHSVYACLSPRCYLLAVTETNTYLCE